MNADLKTKFSFARWPLRLATIVGAVILPALPAQAHPGHSLSEGSFSHLLTNPDHLAVLALAGSAMLVAGYFVRRRLPQRLLQCGGVVALIGAAVLWSFLS